MKSYVLTITIYLIAFVAQILVIHFALDVERWGVSIGFAATIGSLGTWCVRNVHMF